MKNKTLLMLAASLCISTGCSVNKDGEQKKLLQNNVEYFEQLRTQKVESDPIVQWKNIGPGMSGYNEKLWNHPSNTHVMFMAPDMHVTYGTWDAGKSWHSVKDHDELGQMMKRVVDMDFSLQDPNYIIALDWNGWVYESVDQGHNWNKVSELSPSYKDFGVQPHDPLAFKKGWYDEQIGMRLSELSIDPTNDNIWYVGAGDFWNVKQNHRSKENPQGRKLSYADYGYILKSSDKGKSWNKISTGLPSDLDVGKIIVNPNNSLHILMATSHGLMNSHDGGLTWSQESKGLPNNRPRDLTSFYNEKTDQFVLFLVEQTSYESKSDTITSTGGVYKSIDDGVNWINITGNLAIDLNEIHYPAEIDRYYRTLSNWFSISKKEARKKFSTLPSFALPVFNRLVVNPLNQDEIYLTYNKKHDRTFGPGEVWRTLNGGDTWNVVARHGEYWLSGKDKSYWTSRGNATGTNVEFAHVQDYMDTHKENEGNRLLTINAQGELFISISQQTHKSVDKGNTWQQIDDIETAPESNVWIGRGNSDLPGRFMLHETGIPERRLFASGEHGVWQTVNLDEWPDKQAVALKQIEGQNNINGMVSISTIAVHPNNPNIIYILAWRQNHRGKLRRSVDGGKTWENIATVLDNKIDAKVLKSKSIGKVIEGPAGLLPAQDSLIIDPVTPNNMYFVVTKNAFSEIYRAPRRTPTVGDFGFLKSNDGGYTWKTSNNGFHDGFNLRRITFDPTNSNTLYAATSDENGGLYKSVDKGDNWTRVEIPSVIKSVNNVFIDRNTNDILISAGGFYQGGFEEGGAWRSSDAGKTWINIITR